MSCRLILVILGVLCLSSCFYRDKTTLFTEYKNAGDTAYVKKDYIEAEKQYKVALEVAEKEGQENPLVLTSLRSLAQVYLAQGKDNEVEAIYRKRLVIADKIWSQDPKNLALVYDDLAMFYLRENRYPEAKPIYERALSLQEKAFGSNDLKLAESLELYALLLHMINRTDEATRLNERAAAIKSKYTPQDKIK